MSAINIDTTAVRRLHRRGAWIHITPVSRGTFTVDAGVRSSADGRYVYKKWTHQDAYGITQAVVEAVDFISSA